MSPRETFAETFSSLRVRNFRLYTGAQLVSLSGTWMQTIAQNWLVLKLTHDNGVALGLVVALQFLPTLVVGLQFGLLADRFDKRKILLWTQSLAGVLAVVLGVLDATGVVRLWMVYLLAFLLGVVTAADTPARQAFVIEMVGPEDVANAVGLNSATFNAARIIGPALAGAVILAWGIPVAFIFNGVSYLGPVVALAVMNRSALRHAEPAPRAKGQLVEGLRYAWRTREVRRTLLLVSVVATIGFNFSVTIPLLAKITLHGAIGSYTLLTSVLSAGGLLGGLWAAHRARPTQGLLAWSAALFGGLTVLVAASPSLWTAAAVLFAAGAFSMAFIATANSTLQLTTPGPLRGRVMSLYALVFLGSTPIGAPILGWVSQHWTPRIGLGLGGVASLAAALAAILTLQKRERPLPAVSEAPLPVDQPGVPEAVPEVPAPQSA